MVHELRVDAFYARLCMAAVAAGFSSSPLLILPSTADADSFCVVRALAHVLADDSVRFSIYPVTSATAARALLASFSASASAPLCLVLINRGAHRDLRVVLPETATAFVIDSHCPVHLHKLYARNGRVVVLFTADDECAADLSYDFNLAALTNASDLVAEGDADAYRLRVASVSDTDSEDSDADDKDVHGGGTRKRRRLSDNDPDPNVRSV